VVFAGLSNVPGTRAEELKHYDSMSKDFWLLLWSA
jgi:hypothetical protein